MRQGHSKLLTKAASTTAPSTVASSHDVYEPILIKTVPNYKSQPNNHICFEEQKRVWASVDRRSARLKWIASIQVVFSFICCFNYLWITNLFGVAVGLVGLKAVHSDRITWTLVYLILCGLEFARNVIVAPQIYGTYTMPDYTVSQYEYFQLVVLLVENSILVPTAFATVFSATSGLTNPLAP